MGDDEACGTNLPRTHALTQKRESVFCLDSLLLSCRLVRQSLVCAFLLWSGLLCVCVSGGRSARNTLLPSLILSSAYSVTPLTNTECDLSSDPSSFWSGSRLWIVWFLHQLPAAFIYVTIRKDCTGVFFFIQEKVPVSLVWQWLTLKIVLNLINYNFESKLIPVCAVKMVAGA